MITYSHQIYGRRKEAVLSKIKISGCPQDSCWLLANTRVLNPWPARVRLIPNYAMDIPFPLKFYSIFKLFLFRTLLQNIVTKLIFEIAFVDIKYMNISDFYAKIKRVAGRW